MLSSSRLRRRPITQLLLLSALTAFSCASRSEQSSATLEQAPAVEAKTAQTATPRSSEPQARPAPVRSGRITDGPSNVRNFAPQDLAVESSIAADRLDLRKVFEDLGPDATLWYQHVQTLSNPFFEGRGPGTRGMEIAVEYLEFWYSFYGLEPAFAATEPTMGGGFDTSARMRYRQPFEFASPNPEVKLLGIEASVNGEPLKFDSDFVVLGTSSSGSVSAPVTFVGYAIEEGPEEYSSFEGDTDLTGRIALMLRYEPLNEDGKSRWSALRFSQRAGLAAKFQAVARRGATGIILVNPPGAVDGRTGLESLESSRRFGPRLDVPAVQVTPEVADRILKHGDADRRGLQELRQLADQGEVATVPLDDSVQVALRTELEVNDRLATDNVAAILPGKGSLANEWIVIGGHFDHLGYGYTGTAPDNVGHLHPGADDNASGTAGILIAAKRLSQSYDDAGEHANLRSVMFVAFSGEEAGLHGSRYFVENSPVPMGDIVLMINMDMIGRLRNDNLMVQGIDTAEDFEAILEPHVASSGLTISKTPGGRGPSDHSNFFNKQVPVLFLFTGTHGDYHRPADRAYTVNPAGALKIMDFLESVVMDVAARPQKLKFTSASRASGRGGDISRPLSASVSLGTMPDYTAELETGVLVDGIRENSSAAEAGIVKGDVLLTWNGEEISGPRKLAELLTRHQPGDRVSIGLRRGDQELIVEAVLKSRAAQ